MRQRQPPRGAPAEPVHEVGLNSNYLLDQPELRTAHFIGWIRKQLGIAKCRNVREVHAVRTQRAQHARLLRELISRIDDAYVAADDLFPSRTVATLRASGIELQPDNEGNHLGDDELIMDMVTGSLYQALRLARQRLQEQEHRAPIRLEGTPPRIDVEFVTVVHEATALPFAEVVRRVYEKLSNSHGERDAFIANEIRVLQKARQRRARIARRNRTVSGA